MLHILKNFYNTINSMDCFRLLLSLILTCSYFCSVSFVPTAFAAAQNQPLLVDGVITNCSSIPYPFGVAQLKMKPPLSGFEVLCNPRSRDLPMLQLGDYGANVSSISLLNGTVTVNVSPFSWKCGNATQTRLLSLLDTPFTFSSTKNKFTVWGCDVMAMLLSNSRPETMCASTCDGKQTDVDNGGDPCAGDGCCQVPIPKGLKAISSINIYSLVSLYSESEALHWYNESCTQVFLVDQDNFVFNMSQLNGLSSQKMMTSSYPVVLEWSFEYDAYDQVQMGNKSNLMCKDNSEAYNVVDSGGFRCKCSEGYQGNPYVGCEDINECDTHPCIWKCMNKNGGYHCSCPLGYKGDGKIDGDGCKIPEYLVITGVVGMCVLLVIGGLLIYWLLKRRKLAKLKQIYFLKNGGFLLQQNISSQKPSTRIFRIEELKRATKNFSDDCIVGHGGYGTVYKGEMSDKTVVAIKMSKVIDETQIEQFINEVVILSKTNHPNVVKLLGCCLETQVPLLVYEFISNGSLFNHVHGISSRGLVSWKHRLHIAVGTAKALSYLHSASPIPIVHRDVKSANILLDDDYNAKVSDFGASRLVPYNHTHVTTVVQGTFGYLDPEYFQTSQLTEKSDVYSFGVVLVELLTSEKPMSFFQSELNLSSRFSMLLEENRLFGLVDHRIIEEVGALHVLAVAQLTNRCLSLKGEDRPTMNEVAIELNALRNLMITFHDNQLKQLEDLYPLYKPSSSEGSQMSKM